MLRKTRKVVFVVLIVLVVLILIGAAYLNFFYVLECENYSCWQERMKKCSGGAAFINEEAEASWGYEIKGAQEGKCAIEVKLLQAKAGELGISKIIGSGMTCYYPLGIDAYAEKDLSKCTGLLKEELQTIIISKLHSYIIENLGKVEAGLEQAA